MKEKLEKEKTEMVVQKKEISIMNLMGKAIIGKANATGVR